MRGRRIPDVRVCLRLLLLGTAFLEASTAARASDAIANQFWPRLELWYPVSRRARLLLETSWVHDSDAGEQIQFGIGLSLDYRQDRHVSYRVGYKYLLDETAGEGTARSVERRISLDFTYRWSLSRTVQLSDRTRIDLRDLGDDVYPIYRNRLLIENETRLGRQRLLPYASVELFFDPRFDAVTRYYFELGVTLPLSKVVAIKPYLGRQINTRSGAQDVSSLGLTVTLNL
jgi:hypothetical protein